MRTTGGLEFMDGHPAWCEEAHPYRVQRLAKSLATLEYIAYAHITPGAPQYPESVVEKDAAWRDEVDAALVSLGIA